MDTHTHTHEQAPSFGTLLRHYRMERGLPQEELAERAGLSVDAVSALERGVTQWPYRDTVARLATALGLPPAERRTLEAAARRPDRRSLPPAATGRAAAPAVVDRAARRSEAEWAAPLPLPLTALLGRDAELDRLAQVLTQPGGRLLTVTGPGGVGKTRLALEAAHRLWLQPAAAVDTVVLVELAGLHDDLLVPAAVAHALGVRAAPGGSPSAAISAVIGAQPLLLVLDNCEHLIAACAALVADVLAACAHLRVLATSRTPLRLRAEQVLVLAPLALPPLDVDTSMAALQQSAAVALFVERVQAVDPAFALSAANAPAVAALCVRLDGLPLAIELAAAHGAYLSPQALLAHLAPRLPLLSGGARDLPARQQTLRDAIAWSYDLLPAEVQRVFRCLAVCAGGCGSAAAAALCAEGTTPLDPLLLLRHLETLVAASLLHPLQPEQDEPRFAMLETIREYALERLEASGEGAAVRGRHLAWCLALAEEAAPQVMGPAQERWLARLEAEHANLRAALEWALAAGAAELALRLAAALWRFWRVRGYWTEGRRWLERALAFGRGAPGTLRAKALTGAGVLALDQGDHAQAGALFAESLALYRERADKEGIAEVLNNLGLVALTQDDDARAVALYEESLALRRELGDTRGVSMILSNLAQVAWRRGDLARAVALQEESLALDRELGDKGGVALSLSNLGILARQQGDYARATALQEESLALKRDLGFKRGIASSLQNLGSIAQSLGAYARAAALHEESLALMREMDDLRGIGTSLTNLGAVARERGAYAQAAALLEESLVRVRQVGDRRATAATLAELGYCAAQQGAYAQAAALLDESLAVFTALDDRAGRAGALTSLGVLAALQGDDARAACLFEESLALRRALGDRWGVAATLGHRAAVAHRQGAHAQAASLLAESLQLSRALGAVGLQAAGLERLAWVAAARGQPARAARLGGAAQALREALGVPLPPEQQAGHDQTVQALHAALGAAECAAAWQAGAALSAAQALDLALAPHTSSAH